MRFFKFFNILMVIFIYPLYCYADFSKESLSYRGNPLLIQKDFFQQIPKTCIGKDEGLEEKELKMFYEKCIFYKTKSMYQKLWKLPDNQNVLLGEKKDIKLYIKKKVTNRLNQEIQLVLEKSNMITDTFTIQTLIEAHPDYEIAALAGENGLLDYNNSYYIDDDLNITFITISEQEDWLLLPVYYKKYQLNEAAGKYYLFDFKFWRPIYGDSIVYQFIFDIKNNSSSINILPNQTVQKNYPY